MRVIAIYCIKSIDTGKVYVGKSVNVKARWYAHRSALKDSAFILCVTVTSKDTRASGGVRF